MQVLERKNKTTAAPRLLRSVRKYTASEAAAINAYSRLFERASSWEKWIEDTLQDLLEVPNGLKLQISQSNELHGEQTREFVFDQKKISIGRADDNDISLPLNSISRRHAHIVERDGAYHIEDLESSSGTYVNRNKLEPAHPRRLVGGDEVLIFPYVFRVNPQEQWARDEDVKLSYSCRFVRTAASEFASSFGSDMCVFQLGLHPDMGHAILALTRPFLRTILSRLTRESISELAVTDLGLFEFVVISILERANRELRFPFQCVLEPGKDTALQDEPGIALKAAARLAKTQGSIQVFLPDSCLKKSQGTTTAGLPAKVREHLTWQVAVCTGFVDLTVADLADLEQADTLIYTPEMAMILPAGASSMAPERGWHMVRDESNPRRFEVKEYFERSVLMADSTDIQDEGGVTGKAELAALPVRVQIVLSQVELSLKDLEGLTEGSIIELDEENTGSVQLATNGKIVGAGDLVEVDDRLGVQITHWRKD
jgi:type III secretion system YscQ/HrcQ family protein